MIYLQDTDFTLFNGDALEVLRGLPAGSVHMCVTSPPFYGLRDYGMEGQIGLEETPEQWVSKLVDVFREVKRVLRKDGTLWCEIGDSYAANVRSGLGIQDNEGFAPNSWSGKRATQTGRHPYKQKDLVGAPWMLAFALRADGWYLRSDIVWSRPNPMPESVTDRPTKSHSYVFLLTKSSRYFFDQEAVREPHSEKTWFYRDVMPTKPAVQTPDLNTNGTGRSTLGTEAAQHPAGRNVRSVWNINERDEHENEAEISVVVNGELVGRIPVPAGEALSRLRAHGLHAEAPPALVRDVWQIATQPYAEAHFATYPEELVRRCILPGTSERGCCPECGAPWVREVEVEQRLLATRSATAKNQQTDRPLRVGTTNPTRRVGSIGSMPTTTTKAVTTLGWLPSCDHGLAPTPCTVLDPFGGSGTTALVARKHGRRSILIELNESYCALAAERTRQLSLLGDTA